MLVFGVLVLTPFPAAQRVRLLGLWRRLHFGWADRVTRELLAQQRLTAGDLRLGLALWRSAVDDGAAREGYPLIFALTA